MTQSRAAAGQSDASAAVEKYEKLGAIMLREAGAEACQTGYGTTDPEWVGRYALTYGDINPDGTLN